MAITVRQATIEDKPKIFAFLDKAYDEKARFKYPERWEWQFERNPFRNLNELPLWIAINENGEIVGQIGSQVEPLKLGPNLRRRLYWGVDLVVLPEYRNQKIGNLLNRTMIAQNENVIALPMSGAYRHYLLELGAKEVDVAHVFRKYLHLDANAIHAALSGRLGNAALARLFLKAFLALRLGDLIAGCANWVLKRQRVSKKSLCHQDISIVEVKEFDTSIDQFWVSVADEFGVMVERTSQFLNWKYVQQPWLQYRIFLAMREGAISGYVILRRSGPSEGDFGIVADLLSSPCDKESITMLLVHALSWFEQEKVKVVYSASSHPVFQCCFIEQRFSKFKEVHPLFRNLDNSPELEKVYECGKWFFCRSDHDWDQFPLG